MPSGIIVNMDYSMFSEIGTLYLKDGNTFKIVPFETPNTLKAFTELFGSSSLNVVSGKKISYKTDDIGCLSWISEGEG